MKTKYLLFAGLILALGSCSTAYRSGQTPDDVYYSPAPQHDGYVTTNNERDRESYSYNNNYSNEDLEIRRRIGDPRYRSNVMIGTGYGYTPYSYGIYNPYAYSSPYLYNYNSPYGYNSYGYNSYGYNSYDPYYSNYFYSPYSDYYYSPKVYVTPRPQGTVAPATGPRRYNLGVYNNNRTPMNSNNTNIRNGYRPATSNSSPVRSTTVPATNNNNRTRAGNVIRRVFTPNSNNSNRNNNTSDRTNRRENNNNYNNDNNYNSNPSPTRSTSTPSSSSSSSSGSGSAPVRTFRR